MEGRTTAAIRAPGATEARARGAIEARFSDCSGFALTMRALFGFVDWARFSLVAGIGLLSLGVSGLFAERVPLTKSPKFPGNADVSEIKGRVCKDPHGRAVSRLPPSGPSF